MRLAFFIVPVIYISTFANDQTLNIYAPKINSTDNYFSSENSKETNTFNLNDRLNSDVSYYIVAPSNDISRANISFRGVDSRATGFFEDLIPLFKTTQQSIGSYNFFSTDELISNNGIRPSSIGVASPGSDIEILTYRPKEKLEGEMSQTFSNNDSLTLVSVGGKNDKIYYKTSFSFYDRNSYKLSDGFQIDSIQPTKDRINSDKTYKSATVKVGYQTSNNDEIAFKIGMSEADYGIPPTSIDSPSYRYKRIENQNINNFYAYYDKKLEKSELNLRAYYDKYEDKLLEFQDPSYTTLKTSYDEPPTQYHTDRIGALAKLSLFDNKNILSFVLNYEENQNKIIREKYFQYGAVPSWKFQNILSSIILKNKSSDLDVEGALTFKRFAPIKVDYDGYNFAAGTDASSKNIFDGQITLSKSYESSTFYSTLSKTSRIPSMFELATFSSYEILDLGLKPEISQNVEIGVKNNLSMGYFLVSAYYYDIKDRIQKIVIGNNTKYINDSKSINQGINLKCNLEFGEHNLNFGYSYIDAKDSSGDQINLIPHNKVQIEYKLEPTKVFSISTLYNYNSETKYKDSNLNKTIPSYSLVDLSSTYKFQKNISTTVSIKNLFDKNYFYNYDDPAMGRSYYLTLNWKF